MLVNDVTGNFHIKWKTISVGLGQKKKCGGSKISEEPLKFTDIVSLTDKASIDNTSYTLAHTIAFYGTVNKPLSKAMAV